MRKPEQYFSYEELRMIYDAIQHQIDDLHKAQEFAPSMYKVFGSERESYRCICDALGRYMAEAEEIKSR